MNPEEFDKYLADLPFDNPDSQPTVNGAKGRRCTRHEWWHRVEGDVTDDVCVHCGAVRDPTVSRTNRNNRKRGNRTSHDLAAYLSGRNVEALKLPWDVEACGARIQSKRLAQRPSISAIVGLIEYIGTGPALRALYWVGAGQRVSSGRIYVLWPEWHGEHGWLVSEGAGIHLSAKGLVLELPVAAFREIRGTA